MVERGEAALRFRPGAEVEDLRGGSWEVEGDLEALEASVDRGPPRQRDLPRPPGPGLVGADRAALRRLRRLPCARLRGGRLGRGQPRRRRQPRGAARRRLARPAALRRLRPRVGRRARAVDPARRRPGDPRALRARREGEPPSSSLLVVLALFAHPALGARSPERITRAEAIAAADRDPKVREQERKNGELAPAATLDEGNWQVAYFADGDEVALVLVDAGSGEVEESWTGYQVSWKMARGYSGAFGHKLNAPYVFLPLCLDLPARPGRLAAAAAGRQSRPPGPARVRRLPLLLQPGGHRPLGPARLPGARSTCSAAASGSGCGAGGRGCGRSGR